MVFVFPLLIGPEDKYFPVIVQTVCKPVVEFPNWMPSRKKNCQNGKTFLHSDAQSGPANRQMTFSGRGDESSAHKLPFTGLIVKKFQNPNILCPKHSEPCSKQDDGSTTS